MTTATLSKVLFHACPRCHGDLFLDIDQEMYGCLQCGREVSKSRLEALATIDVVLAAEMTPHLNSLHLVSSVKESKELNDDAA